MLKANAKNKQINDCLKQALILRTTINAWIRIMKDYSMHYSMQNNKHKC